MPYAFDEPNAYVLVQDVPASWEHYKPLGAAIGDRVPEGLILHVAGPTDEGFRTIDVWETREARERFDAGLRTQVLGSQQPFLAPATLRELCALNAVLGTAAHEGKKGEE